MDTQTLAHIPGAQGFKVEDPRTPVEKMRRKEFSRFLSSIGFKHDPTRPLDELKAFAVRSGLDLTRAAHEIISGMAALPEAQDPETLLPPSGPQETPLDPVFQDAEKPKKVHPMTLRKQLQSKDHKWQDLMKMKTPELEALLGGKST